MSKALMRLLWFLSFVASILCYGVGAQATTDTWLLASPVFVQLRWPSASLLQVSLTEPALVAGTKSFYSTEAVKVLSVRNATVVDSASRATYEVLFLIGDPTQAFNTTVAPATLSTTGLATALGKRLEAAVQDVAGAKNATEPLWQVVTAFQGGSVTCQTLTNAEVLTLYKSAPNFPAIRTPASPAPSAFLTFSVFFRNVNDPAKLPQSVVFQVRRGVAEFLGGAFDLTYVTSSGPAIAASDSTLQVNQTFYLRLPSTADTSMLERENLANLLLYGDLTRVVAGDSAGSTRPAMFLDYIFASTELSAALSSQALAGSQSFAATLIPYVFRYANVDTFPVGNPALPGAVTDTATLLSVISEDALNALRRKKQRFRYDPDGYAAALPKDVTYPSSISLSNMDLTGVFTTTVYWSNTLDQEFWLESAESTDAVSWNLYPSTSFFLDDSSSSSSLPPAPIVRLGNTSTPLWTLQGATPERLDMALNFQSTDDNATLVKVEIAVTLHSSGDAESTVTSIARPATSSSTSSSSSSVSPLNVVVRHESRLLRNGATDKVSKLLLRLEFGVADVTEKAANGCAHCLQLIDWCSNESVCASLRTCVLTGLQTPLSQLVSATATASETDDLYSVFNGCLAGSATTPVDVNSLMLFTSAIRCQLKRLCAIQSPSTSTVIPSGIKLVWGSGKGQHRILPTSTTGSFPAPTSTPVNISLAIGSRVVCYIPLWSNATAASMELRITRSCTFAKYLGTVQATVNSSTAGATSVDISYDGLVGPLPTLTAVSNDQAVGARITTISTPSIRVRYVSAAGPVPYAATTDPTPTETCVECKRLALDVCLRDAKCAAMADCVMQYQGSTTATVTTDGSTALPSLADAILTLVRGDQTGTKLSLEAGVTSCLPAVITNGVSTVDVNGASWRKLVNASACYSRNTCPLVLAPTLASSWSSLATNYLTVGKWSISPTRKLQRLIYTGSTSSLSQLQVPLALTRDGSAVTLSSAADPDSLAASLRTPIQYDDIQVAQTVVDATTTSTGATTFAWTISYGHWAGSLPTFISPDSKEWTLAAFPTITAGVAVPNDSILELVPRGSSSIASATVTTSTTATL
ncbi:unnamed protein product [Phytophthora lilii]|uniref:Unnamed protein product n=1 Tax=Phytophthora lilii TaxID=2077276 RepID=A0A9W6WTM4_9STRA|nr:unnamed protein product [Phytophthora lilii]